MFAPLSLNGNSVTWTILTNSITQTVTSPTSDERNFYTESGPNSHLTKESEIFLRISENLDFLEVQEEKLENHKNN